MRALIIILLTLSVGVTACSKKGSTTVVTTPAPSPNPNPNPNPNPDPQVDPYTNNHDMRKDDIHFNKMSEGWFIRNPTLSARTAYENLLHSAHSYFATFVNNNKYGSLNNFDYEDGSTCDFDFLDDIEGRLYNPNRPLHDMFFSDCNEYWDYIEELAQGKLYFKNVKQLDGNIVEGEMHAAVQTGPNTYTTQLVIPFRGKIEKDVFAVPTYRYYINIGSALSIYTDDSTVTDPDDRALYMEFDGTDMGSMILDTP